MNGLLNRIAAGMAIGGAGLLTLGIGCYAAGARINTTKSIPVGLYWTSNKPVEKGAYVLFCPPKARVFDDAKSRGYIGAGFCPSDYGYLMKRVLAVQSDVVSITDEGVWVNDALLPLSVPITTDGTGRALPRYRANRFSLRESEVLLMSDVSSTSFDGRYFGPIARSHIKTVISPVLTW
jgi:conjugative transfer signal peptidase TraF